MPDGHKDRALQADGTPLEIRKRERTNQNFYYKIMS